MRTSPPVIWALNPGVAVLAASDLKIWNEVVLPFLLPNALERDGKAVAAVIKLVELMSPVANPNPDQEEQPKEEKPVDVLCAPKCES